MTDDVEMFLRRLEPEVREITSALRTVVRSELPDAVEETRGGWTVIGYSADGRMQTTICAIAPQPGHVNLQFFYGARLQEEADPEGLLEGTGRRGRHVKFRSPEETGRSAVRALLAQARELAPTG